MACENTIVLSKDTNLKQVIGEIKDLTIKGAANPIVQKIAQKCSLNVNPVKCAFDSVYSLVIYEPDPDDRQILKAVHCTLQSGKGNCVDYSILLGAILLNLNIDYSFKVVSFSDSNGYDHIYIQTKDGTILDPVLGQKQDGTDTRGNRPINGQYNQQCNYKYSKLYPMASLEVLQGTGTMKISYLGTTILPSRVEATRMGIRKGVMQGTTLRYTDVPGGTITSASGITATLGPGQDASGNYKVSSSSPAFDNATSGTAAAAMFFNGDTLYTKNTAGYFYNDGSGWQVTNAAVFNSLLVTAQAAAVLTSSSSTPFLIIGGLGLAAAGYFLFVRKRKKSKS